MHVAHSSLADRRGIYVTVKRQQMALVSLLTTQLLSEAIYVGRIGELFIQDDDTTWHSLLMHERRYTLA